MKMAYRFRQELAHAIRETRLTLKMNGYLASKANVCYFLAQEALVKRASAYKRRSEKEAEIAYEIELWCARQEITTQCDY